MASLLLLIAACADTPPPAGTPFTLSPNPIGLRAIGQTLSPTATTTAGATLDPTTLAWSVVDEDVATVAADGTVRATGSGSTTLVATRTGATSTATIDVDATIEVAPCVRVPQLGSIDCAPLILQVTAP